MSGSIEGTTAVARAERRRLRRTAFGSALAGASVAVLLGGGAMVWASDSFTDVPSTNAFHDEIGWMKDSGISTGFNGGTIYKPGDAVSRQSMSAFMFRLAQFVTPDVVTMSGAANQTISSATFTNVTNGDAHVQIPPGSTTDVLVTFTTQNRCIEGDFPADAIETCQLKLEHDGSVLFPGARTFTIRPADGGTVTTTTVSWVVPNLPGGLVGHHFQVQGMATQDDGDIDTSFNLQNTLIVAVPYIDPTL